MHQRDPPEVVVLLVPPPAISVHFHADMKFFVPHIGDGHDGEKALASMRQAAQVVTRRVPTERRVQAIQYWVSGKQYDAEVGKPLVQLGLRHDQKGEEVLAILETRDPDQFLVFTPTNGGQKGLPIVVSQEDSFAIVEFDP